MQNERWKVNGHEIVLGDGTPLSAGNHQNAVEIVAAHNAAIGRATAPAPQAGGTRGAEALAEPQQDTRDASQEQP